MVRRYSLLTNDLSYANKTGLCLITECYVELVANKSTFATFSFLFDRLTPDLRSLLFRHSRPVKDWY